MKKKGLLTTVVFGLLTFLAYVLIANAVDYYVSSSGPVYYGKIIWKATLNGTTDSDRFGYSIATGDINNDSYADIVVGADGHHIQEVMALVRFTFSSELLMVFLIWQM